LFSLNDLQLNIRKKEELFAEPLLPLLPADLDEHSDDLALL